MTNQIPDYSQASECAICGFTLAVPAARDSDSWVASCPNCGGYKISETALVVLMNKKAVDAKRSMLLAHLVRRRERSGSPTLIGSELVRSAFDEDQVFPDAFEQVSNLVIWLAENLQYPGQAIDIEFPMFQAIIGAADANGFSWVVRSAYEQGWVAGIEHESMGAPFGLVHASLTLQGWQWYEEFGKHQRSRIAFMAMQYGDETLDRIVESHFAPAVAETGFLLKRLDDNPEAGIIDNRLRVEIRRSIFVIADLTHDNRGAYWEAGFAEGLGLPVIYTCESTKLRSGVHFDTRNSQIVPWDQEDLEAASASIKATIRNSLPDDAVLEDTLE